jgi:hypothetical protein
VSIGDDGSFGDAMAGDKIAAPSHCPQIRCPALSLEMQGHWPIGSTNGGKWVGPADLNVVYPEILTRLLGAEIHDILKLSIFNASAHNLSTLKTGNPQFHLWMRVY